MIDDFEHMSQTTDVNVMNGVKLSSDLCESNAVHLNEEKCDVDISDNTGENNVDIPVQRNCNLFSITDTHFKCDICFKSFDSKHSIIKHLYIHRNDKGLTCDICNK